MAKNCYCIYTSRWGLVGLHSTPGGENGFSLEERLVDCLMQRRLSARSVVASAASEFPAVTGLQLIFAMLSVSESLQLWVESNDRLRPLSDEVNEACALLAADLYALEMLGKDRATCADLREFWGDHERFFANLP